MVHIALQLAIVKHRKNLSDRSEDVVRFLDLRATKAAEFLREQLAKWDPKVDSRNKLIVLVPALLTMLRSEDMCFCLDKSAQLEDYILGISHNSGYGLNTKLYYLEAYIARVERRDLENSEALQVGVMCSPSSTAVFLLDSELGNQEYEHI